MSKKKVAATKKKKLTAAQRRAFEKRSAAAKKGWAIKRRIEKQKALAMKIRKQEKLANNTRKVNPKKKTNAGIGRRRGNVSHILLEQMLPERPRIVTAGKTVKQLREMLEESERKRKYLEGEMQAQIETQDFVDIRGPEWLREDFSIAMQDSRLRHNIFGKEALNVMREAVAEAKTPRQKEQALKDAADYLADYLDVPLREIYTLYYSP